MSTYIVSSTNDGAHVASHRRGGDFGAARPIRLGCGEAITATDSWGPQSKQIGQYVQFSKGGATISCSGHLAGKIASSWHVADGVVCDEASKQSHVRVTRQ